MPTQLKRPREDIEYVSNWLAPRLPHVVKIKVGYPYHQAKEWGQNTFGPPGRITVGCWPHNEEVDWTWFEDHYYFRKERDAVVFKLRWG